MKKLLICSIVFLILTVACEQTIAQPAIEWAKCFGSICPDLAKSMQQTLDKGYIIAGDADCNSGNVTGNHGSYDFWIVKSDSLGNLQWQKSLGGANMDQAYSIQQTQEGGYIVCGTTDSNDGDVTGFHSIYDFWIVKLDSAGNKQWQKCVGGQWGDQAYAVKQTFDGGYIVTGRTMSNDGDVSGNHGNNDVWVVKLSSAGKHPLI